MGLAVVSDAKAPLSDHSGDAVVWTYALMPVAPCWIVSRKSLAPAACRTVSVMFAIVRQALAARCVLPAARLCGNVRVCAVEAATGLTMPATREATLRRAEPLGRHRVCARSSRAGASRGSTSPIRPRSASRPWRRRWPAAGRSRSPPRSGWKRRSASRCAPEARTAIRAEAAASSLANGVAPADLGYYARQSVSWIEGDYLTLRPSFGDKDAIYAYRTQIVWDEQRIRA